MLKTNLNIKKKLKSNRNIIFCTSALFFPYAISLIAKYKNSSVLITQSKEIFKFFTKYYPNYETVFFENPKSITSKNPIKIIINNYYNYLLKKKIYLFSKQYSNSNVFTNIDAFSPYVAYMITILSKKNKIYHQKIIKVFFKKTKSNLKYKILKFYKKIFLGLDVDVVETRSKNYILLYSNKFFKKIGSKKIKYKVNNNVIRNFAKKNFDIYDKKILLLSSGISLKNQLIDKKLFYNFMKKWNNENNFKKLILKRKNFKEKKLYFEKNLSEIPTYIPLNLLIYNFKVVVSYNSAILFEAANKSCKAISLLYILSKEAKTIDFYEEYLNSNLQRGKKIFYPKTYEQFIKYLNTVSI